MFFQPEIGILVSLASRLIDYTIKRNEAGSCANVRGVVEKTMQFLFVYTVEWQEANIINIDVC
jgi:hypothetical protein